MTLDPMSTSSAAGRGRSTTAAYLPAVPVRPVPDRLDAPYWEAAAHDRLVAQQCGACARWQWGPEWICHRCRSFDIEWQEVAPHAVIYSWERVWHPTRALLKDAVPYLVVLVELPQADGIRMVGNLLGDPRAEVRIGATVRTVFEHHDGFSLVQWEVP